MPVFEASSIQSVVLHRVGNKATEEGYVLSTEPLHLTEQLQDVLVRYFLGPFKVEEYYRLYSDDGVEMNPLYRHCADIFSDPECLMESSCDIARLLYDKETGLGLRIYRYNIGGGEADNPDCRIWDRTRRTESFYYFNEDNVNGIDYLNDDKFKNIYTEKNTFTNIDDLIACITNKRE